MVDLATGVCTPQPPLLSQHGCLVDCSAARLPDGRVVCVGRNIDDGLDRTAQVLERLEVGSPSEASWQWRYLPGMTVGLGSGGGCVLSDGRFAAFGGSWSMDYTNTVTSSCEVLTMDGNGERWGSLPPLHDVWSAFACELIGGCVIIAGGNLSITTEVYEEALGRWRLLPCDVPCFSLWGAGRCEYSNVQYKRRRSFRWGLAVCLVGGVPPCFKAVYG
jgi:hypothetical protein